ncbi:SLAP domain-containing protein [Paraliobacillus ryukyuensis]|uniref:SLAP domain-containing protein n=1 Tax=Paraliobacillus ryukyuensis TaxID=200904 RepID=UPI0015C4A768|nr:SLAP domain-containing protein [Paraliobacillus ryukyuensis]
MQQLQFEDAWKRTISDQDRKLIYQVFNDTVIDTSSTIKVSNVRHDTNHKEEELMISIIHNFSESDFTLSNCYIEYLENKTVIATQHFHFPTITIPAHTSMPWTFIFPKESFEQQPSWELGELRIGEGAN